MTDDSRAEIVPITQDVAIERLRTQIYLRSLVTAKHRWLDAHIAVSVLWALTHPIRFAREYARVMAISAAADALARGEHLTAFKKEQGL